MVLIIIFLVLEKNEVVEKKNRYLQKMARIMRCDKIFWSKVLTPHATC